MGTDRRADGRADGRADERKDRRTDMTKLTAALSNFVNVPNNSTVNLVLYFLNHQLI